MTNSSSGIADKLEELAKSLRECNLDLEQKKSNDACLLFYAAGSKVLHVYRECWR